MDLPSKNMYDTLKDEIWKELGPLDPDWFEALTAQAFTNEGNASDQEDLCANQEGHFKTPFDKTAVDSQLFSTPKVFRHRRVVSPETEEPSSTAEQGKERSPWAATQSPCLFQMSKDRVQSAKYGGVQPLSEDSFDVLHTPQKSPASYARLISESLGAEIHPDVSWTSSLNTPPAIASTLILTQPEESPRPVSVSANQSVVFVRKLFPSLSNALRVGAASAKNHDVPPVHQGVVSPEADQNPERPRSPQGSLNQSDCVWRQKLPDAIEDGEIRSTVANVLDGAEDVLSIFFSNSSSALRKVKTDRIKRKQIIPTEEHDCSSTDVSVTNNAASSEQRTAEQEPDRLPSLPPVKTEDKGITQWSPLSLSEIPPFTVDVSCSENISEQTEGNMLTEKLQSGFDSGQVVRPHMKITDSGFTKKKRKFVYTVKTSKSQLQGEETESQRMDASPGIPDCGQEGNMKQLVKAAHEADCEVQKQGNLTEENLPHSLQAKVVDFDISQLSRDFAQDFTQIPTPTKLSKLAEETPRNGFSPSACLSAVKRANQKARQAKFYQDCDDVIDRRSVSAANQSNSMNEVTVGDSGFQSAVADITHVTASSFGQSQPWTDFKTSIQKIASFPSTNKENGKACLDAVFQGAETDAKLFSAVKENQTLDPGRESVMCTESTSVQPPSCAKGTADNINCIPPHGQRHGSLPEKTTFPLPSICAPGFKTASNKGIHISSATLEKAKRLFEETERETAFCSQPIRCAHGSKDQPNLSRGSVTNTACNSNQPLASGENIADNSFQLTASQKAEVTELCTLLEEADSQFEFTQFKTAELKQHCQDNATSPQKVDRELDPDFLAGIDFDDSFNFDAEKQPAVKLMQDTKTSVSDGKSNRETSNVTSKSTGLSSREMKEENPTAEDASSSKSIPESINSRMSAETSKLEDENPLMLGAGFKTAGGNVLRVSKKCLSKARALFADLEESLVASQTLLHKQISENEFQLQRKRSVNNCAGNIWQQEEEGEKVMSSDRQVTDVSDEDMTKGLKNSKVDPTKHQMGFQKASGKEISISEKAMREADASFKDCKMMDTDPGMSVKHEKSLEASSASASHEENLQKCKNIQGIKANLSKEPINEFENVNARPATGHTEALQHNVDIHNFSFKNAADHTKAGNLSLTAKELSSCTTSKHFVSSAINGLSSGGGFSTASGKKVLVSADAMKKAKCLLNDTDTLEEAFKQPKQMKDASRTGHHVTETPKNGGFQTASGKGVHISSAALKKAKSLFSECDEIDDKINVKPTYSKMPVPGPPPTHSGFLAASGKPVAFSSEALQKAKALFSDIGFSAQIPAALDTNNGDKKKDAAENIQEMHFGFSTARGAKVHVSQKNLQKAKHLLREFDDMQDAEAFFKDCDIMDSKDGMSVKNRGYLVPVSGSGVEEENLSKFKLEQSVTGNIAEVSGNGCAEPENKQFANHEKMLQSVESLKGGFKNTLHSTSEASSEGKPSSKVKPSLMSAASSSTGIASINELSNSGGFCTASGKKVSVSDEAVRKAKSLFNENASFEGTNNQLEQRAETLPPLNSGFQTASGKGVAVSSAALTRAKTLLSECDVNDKINVKPTFSEMPISAPPPRNCGFLAASGKKVAFSSEALQKAKALFSDISFSADTATAPETRSSEHSDAQNDTEKILSGFTTAEGARVHVSQKSLLKDFVNGECHELDSYSTSVQNAHKSDLSNVNHVRRTSNSNLPPAGEKGMAAEESAPQVVHSLTSLQATDCGTETAPNSTAHGCIRVQEKAPTDAFKLKEGEHHDNTGEETTNALNSEINRTGSSAGSKVRGAEESSILYIQSFGLSDCTETQQEFFAREALDCTKALLEDEKFSMTSENLPLQGNQKSSNRRVEEQKRKGRRLEEEEEEEDMSGQPPLKRRLLEEFDRTVDGPRGSTLHRQISSPNGVMKDRGVFKYSTSLYPNITRPHSSDKNDVKSGLQKTIPTQHLIPGDNRAAHSKTSTFVPPFLKSTESRKNTMLKDNTRTPSAFVPPFKKQRTVVQESSFKAQEEDKSHHVFVTPLESNTYIPPSEKPQSADVTSNKCKEDFQIVALAETTNDDQNNQNVPVGCGSKEAPAETSCLQDTLPRNQDMFQNLHNIELARDMQDMRIRKKKRQTIRPLPGSLFLTKTSGGSRIPLKAAVSGSCPARCSQKQLYIHGVHQHVSEITSETAESFRFSLQHFIKQEAFRDEGGVQLADGGWLIPSTDGSAGKEEFYRALCDTPGVDPKLITEEWVYNHYRWIVWKRASMERSFPETMGSISLTPEQVLLQLKYRYDVEVDHSRRPALRKIMEKDDTAAKTLILCVCGVVSKGLSPKKRSYGDTKTPAADARVENPCAVVWLTDGWYAIKAQLDEPLTAMLHKGRLAVGGKLIIHGAQLVGSQDACSPLEAPDSLMLKICANSSRPARWDAKLGFHRDPRPFLLPVSCLYSNGGPVGCVDVIILRSYPIQWMERKPDGGVVFRSVRAEEKEVRRYNSHKQKAMEVLFAKIQAEFEKDEKGNNKPQRRRRTISRQDIASLQDGEELYEAVGDDPAYLEAHLSEQQLETLRSYRRSQMEKKQAELQDRYRRALENAEDREGSCPKRDVTPVWRLCIADSLDRPGTVYQLNLWRPPSDLQSLLKEGCRYKVYNLTTSEGKKHGGGANVQLSGTKKTQFQDLQASQEWLSTHFQPRVSTQFEDLQNPEYQPLCGEVDLTGYVISVIDEKGSSPAFYLVDGKLNFVKVRCFSSLAQSGLEDVIKPRVLLALSNLQLRGQSTSPTPVVYAGDLTVFSTNPKEVHLQESLCQLRHLAQGQENFCLTAEEKLSDLVRSDGLSSVSTPALQAGTPASTTDRRQDTKTSVTSKQPVRSLGFFTPVSRNPQTTKRSSEKDPVSLKRRRALDYLSRIPSPPPISSLSSVASPCVRKTFNPPRRSGTPSTLKTVQTPARKAVTSLVEDDLVNDEELAMIDTQALLVGDLM